MKSFVEKLGLVSLWHSNPIDYTHVHTDGVSTAVLDHFLCNERLLPLVLECTPLHTGDNLSRHSPILLRLNVGEIPRKQKISSWLPKKPAWYKASMADIQNYKQDLQDRLQSLGTPGCLMCRNPHCNDSAHSDERDSFVLDILCSVIEASHTRIPMAGGRRATPQDSHSVGGSMPGWNEDVEPFRQDALFWHGVW